MAEIHTNTGAYYTLAQFGKIGYNLNKGGACMSDVGYTRITLKVREEWSFRDVVKQAADKKGESVNGFMIKAIRDAAKQAGVSFPVPVYEAEAEK